MNKSLTITSEEKPIEVVDRFDLRETWHYYAPKETGGDVVFHNGSSIHLDDSRYIKFLEALQDEAKFFIYGKDGFALSSVATFTHTTEQRIDRFPFPEPETPPKKEMTPEEKERYEKRYTAFREALNRYR